MPVVNLLTTRSDSAAAVAVGGSDAVREIAVVTLVCTAQHHTETHTEGQGFDIVVVVGKSSSFNFSFSS